MMKKLKYGLFGIISLIGLSCFCSAYDVYSSKYTTLTVPGVSSVSFDTGLCLLGTNFGNVYITDLNNHFVLQGVNDNDKLFCFDFAGKIWSDVSVNTNLRIFTGINDYFSSSFVCPSCPSCPSCSSSTLFLDQEPEDGMGFHDSFDLSGIGNVYFDFPDDITYNYSESSGYLQFNLVNNRLINTGIDLSGLEWSALFINDIQHVSAPLINITIPEEFEWTYTGNDEEFVLNISGYNVDTEYIAGIINNQTTLPNDKDFNNIITGLIPLFVPGLCVILLLVFIFRFIKKIF